jgi:hypothetical protein
MIRGEQVEQHESGPIVTVRQELEGDGDGVKRRDFLYLATATLGLAGAALAT